MKHDCVAVPSSIPSSDSVERRASRGAARHGQSRVVRREALHGRAGARTQPLARVCLFCDVSLKKLFTSIHESGWHAHTRAREA